MNKDELIIVMCPPLSDYPKAPEDQSESEIYDCPECKNKMWISEKKKEMILFSSYMNRDILIACYHCITHLAQENPYLFRNSEQVNI